MQVIGRVFKTIKANLVSVVVASLFLGLVAGQVIAPGTKTALQSAVLPVLFLMIYPMMINIDLQEVLNVGAHARVVVASLLLNFGLAPLVAVALAEIFFQGNPEYAVGLYFIALIPTSGMTAAWTGLAGGDLEGALVAMAVNLLAAVVVLPIYLSVLLEQGVGFDPDALYRQLAFVVVIPMVAGNLTRRYLLRRYDREGFKRLKPTFGGLSSLGVMLIVFIAMAMRSTEILADPVASGLVVVPLVVFYAVILVVGSAVGRFLLDPPGEVALVYATGMRNLSIAIAYVIQPPLGAVYMQYRRDVVERGLSVRELLASRVRA